MAGERWGRRQFLGRAMAAGGGVVALAGSGYAGYRWPRGSGGGSAPTSPSSPPSSVPARGDTDAVDHFVTRPDLTPPRVTVTHRRLSGLPAPAGPRYVLVSPKGYQADGPGQQGLMILDRRGRLVWFLPRPGHSSSPFDLQVQTYRGQQVLTWWQGTVVTGHGQGSCHVADSSYREIATVQAGNGLQADLHELCLTPHGTALITAYRTAAADLSAIGGPRRGQVLACQAQEVDVQSGRLLFSWDSLDHVPVTESYGKPATGKSAAPFDYFHINSVSLAPDGDLLISARNTWTVYKVARPGGEVVWRLNGKRSDFEMGGGSRFYWQH
ncbi:MAG: arylsulfotransferase family protein, partial [Acidimicrobiales bacterium]